MTPARALIEAAEEMLLFCKHEGPDFEDVDDEGRCECTRSFDRREAALKAAIVAAKAAEDGVETTYTVMGALGGLSMKPVIHDPHHETLESAQERCKKLSPIVDRHIVRREIRTTVIEVREKEGL
jgi:hypothetical protein